MVHRPAVSRRPCLGFYLLTIMAFVNFLPMIGAALQNIWNSTIGQSQSKEMMRYQYQLNQQAIDTQNRYNSPIAQMERLRDAGLNPNLVYGNGVDGNQSSAASVGIASRQQAADFGFADVVRNIFQRRQLENETMLANAQKDQIKANEMLATARYLDVMEDVARKDSTFDTYVETAKEKLFNLQMDSAKKYSDIQVNEQRRDNIVQQTNNLKIVANNLIEQGNYLAARTGLTQQQQLTEIVKRRSMEAGIYLTYKQAEQVAHMISYIDAGTDLRELGYDVQETDFHSNDELQKWFKDHPNAELTYQAATGLLGLIGQVVGINVRGKSTRKRSKRR